MTCCLKTRLAQARKLELSPLALRYLKALLRRESVLSATDGTRLVQQETPSHHVQGPGWGHIVAGPLESYRVQGPGWEHIITGPSEIAIRLGYLSLAAWRAATPRATGLDWDTRECVGRGAEILGLGQWREDGVAWCLPASGWRVTRTGAVWEVWRGGRKMAWATCVPGDYLGVNGKPYLLPAWDLTELDLLAWVVAEALEPAP